MLEPLTLPRAGLFTKELAPVPLDGVTIDAELSAFCARVVVTQRFVNRETKPIEAVYVFPLDEGAAVCGFEAIIDGTLVVGEVKDREEAFRLYDEAIEHGHGGYLLDEERPDVFQASVGNLPPGKEVLLKLTYVTELTVERDSIRFSIPTTVSPRYAPAEDHRGIGRSAAETLNPPLAWQVPYGLSLSVKVAMAGTITRLESPSHPVAVELHGQDATVTLAQRDAALDRDFVLSIAADGLNVPRAWVERGEDGEESVAVSFVPTLNQASVPSEIVFLVDRSGSMAGTSIEEVRNALQLCLRSMIPGCCFNIYGFGSTFERLFAESRPYDEQSLAKAAEHVSSHDANLGGMEILPALRAVLEQPRYAALPRQVVILTDGQVTNTDAVLALAKEQAAEARIFTFGIGAAASHHLVKGLARAGAGTAEFIHPGERIEPKVIRLFGRLLSPAITNVRIDWCGADVVQAPSVVPPVFSDGRLLVYGFMKQGGATPARARLSADAPTGSKTWDVEIDTGKAVTGRTVATLAARSRIRELEEGPEWTKTRGSRQSDRKPDRVREEIIALSTRYGVVSRETSYVAVERRDTPVQGDIQLRRVPVQLTTGWGGLEERLFARGVQDLATASLVAGPALSARSLQARTSIEARSHGFFVKDVAKPQPERPGWKMFWNRSKATEQVSAVGMHALIRLQHADGSWDLTRQFAEAIGQDLRDLERPLSGVTGPGDEARRAWATALALAWLDHVAPDAEPEWRILAVKAHKWLDGVTAAPADGTSWRDAAAKFLQAL